MKVKTTASVKFMRLKRRLSLSHYKTVGLLESLWIITAQNAPDGNIGKFSNEDLAAMVEWEGSADELIAGLVDTGWLDSCPVDRLVVHDWLDHCPTWVRGVLANPCKKKPPLSPPLRPVTGAAKVGLIPHSSPPLPSLLFPSLTFSSPLGGEGLPFLCRGWPSDWVPPPRRIDEWVTQFPAINIPVELGKMKHWLDMNPDRRKTARGMVNFVLGWLKRIVPVAKGLSAIDHLADLGGES